MSREELFEIKRYVQDFRPKGLITDYSERVIHALEVAWVELDSLRADVREWLCIHCNTVYPGPPQDDFTCVICPHCEGTTGPRILIERDQLKHRVRELERGKHICKQCELRKYSEQQPAEF